LFAILRRSADADAAAAIERLVRKGADRELCRIKALVFAAAIVVAGLAWPAAVQAGSAEQAQTASPAVVPTGAQGDFAGRVAIPGGRMLYLECRGTGTPTVVLEAGTGDRGDVWSAAPSGPGHAVLLAVARFTRVCAYDRPGVRFDGPDQSTPVAQPHPADEAADDLHGLLTAAGESGPYVLVPHSSGGIIAALFARTWPAEVDGLVMVDVATQLIQQVASPEAVTKWDEVNGRSGPEAPEAVMLLDAFARIDALPPLREMPAVVLRADKPWQPPSTPKQDLAAGGVTFVEWQASEDLLAEALGARLVTEIHSGHHVYLYSPALVIDAIREVVGAVRSGDTRVAK
jgi:pimeloyl-ACP methyl ester carboxylesterase